MILTGTNIVSKDIEKLLGYLGFASWIEPFGRPFLSAIDSMINRRDPGRRIRLGTWATIALQIWEIILRLNRGLSYDFILNRLPAVENAIFVDASTS